MTQLRKAITYRFIKSQEIKTGVQSAALFIAVQKCKALLCTPDFCVILAKK